MSVKQSGRYRRLRRDALARPGGKEAYESGRKSVRAARTSKKSNSSSRARS